MNEPLPLGYLDSGEPDGVPCLLVGPVVDQLPAEAEIGDLKTFDGGMHVCLGGGRWNCIGKEGELTSHDERIVRDDKVPT